MKVKKALPVILSVLMVGGVFAGCTNNSPSGNDGEHTQHSYVYAKVDGEYHKKTCSGCNDIDVNEKHVYDNETDTTCNYCTHVREINGGDNTAEDTSTKYNGKIYVVGDSTVCSFNDPYYIPRYGYGTQISNYINMDASNVKNLALSGRSSWSFTTETNYSTLTSEIGSGDYLFIGFGHNDQKREVARYTDPTLASDDTSKTIGTYTASRTVSFKYVLKHYYIDVAKAAGATPILCTPITRLFEDNKKTNYDTVHVTTTGSEKDSNSGVTTTWNGGDYVKAIKDLAEEENLLCVDLTNITKTDYKALGYDEAIKYHAVPGAKWADDSKTTVVATKPDETHTNKYGAKMNAYYIANAVKSADIPLAANVRTNISKPTYDKNELINSSYTIPDKGPFDPTKDVSTFWKGINGTTIDTTDTQNQYKWYATAFGGSAKADSKYFTITQDNSNGLSFTLKSELGKGKIEGSGDSIAAVFIQVPFKTAFTVTAKATIKSYEGNQAGFGLMVRDDIYIDENTAVNSNYVTAGCRGTSTKAVMGYARNGGSLTDSSNKVEYPTAGSVLDLSIARSSQSITANTGAYTYSAVSDFDLAISDSEYVYICLWVARAEVTFSEITFTSGTWVNA